MKDNRRSYVRIQAEVGLVWRRLSGDEAERLSATFEGRSRSVGLVSEFSHRSEQLLPSMRKIRADHPEIAAWIKYLQGAVSTLAEQVAFADESNTQTKPYQVTISAAGMEFNSDVTCERGEMLELVLELLPSRSRIMVVGEVVHANNVPSTIARPAEKCVALAFRYIRDADQELLIRHIHRAQIEDLRKARTERKAA